jgi:tRNA(adenine34) deaminase
VKSSGFNSVFMQKALMLAVEAYNNDEIPVGAVIVNRKEQTIIAEAHNIMQKHNNSLLHAEIVAINRACQGLNSKYLENCDIYVSLEPCVMCAAAISYAKISRLFYAAADRKQGAVEHGVRFFTKKSCFHRPEVYDNLDAEKSQQLIKSFFRQIRKNGL